MPVGDGKEVTIVHWSFILVFVARSHCIGQVQHIYNWPLEYSDWLGQVTCLTNQIEPLWGNSRLAGNLTS